eukprot:5784045-Pleurochrysis_carterae.AAC.2
MTERNFRTSKSVQERHVKEQAALMKAKSLEVDEAVADLIELLGTYQFESGISPPADADLAALRGHYAKLLYRAVRNCTRNSLVAIKKRVGSRASAGFLFLERPFFDVD